jgi:hypothetical protein
MAAFQVSDLEVSRRVFSVCGTSTRVFALDEQLGAWGAGEPSSPNGVITGTALSLGRE